MPKAGHDDIEPTEGDRIDAMEFVARVLVQIPDPRRDKIPRPPPLSSQPLVTPA